MARIQNGRLVDIPDTGMYGSDIIKAIKPDRGRRPVIRNGTRVEKVEPGKFYPRNQLFDRHGNPVGAGDMPDRTKGQGL